MSKRPRLGGNAALTDAPSSSDAVRTVHAAAAAPRGEVLRDVPVGALARSPWQPREVIDGDRLDELAESVRARGVLEPLLAREVTGKVTENHGENPGRNPGGGARLELLAGERRLEAARRAGLATVPVRVLSGLSDAEAREVAVVENLARADLTVWDEARALLALRDARRAEGKPDDVRSVAAAAGRSSATTWRRLRVAERLTPDVVAAVRASFQVGTRLRITPSRLRRPLMRTRRKSAGAYSARRPAPARPGSPRKPRGSAGRRSGRP
jgi:ParB family chromosome partitioning protein